MRMRFRWSICSQLATRRPRFESVTWYDGTFSRQRGNILEPLSTLRQDQQRCTHGLLQHRRKDLLDTVDTIYALSTASGRAAIAIIRVSGPACLDIYGALCPDRPFPSPRTATLRQLSDPHDRSRKLDSGALILHFPSPNTVTGEDVLELHIHGGPAIVQSVLEAIPRCTNSRTRRRSGEHSNIRAAEPGEFTKRAFYNGRLDLTEAEALGESLAAETEQQRRLAIAGVGSDLAKRYERWRTQLLHARAELEALIDFSEDQHFDESPSQFMASVTAQVLVLKEQMSLHIVNSNRGELLRNGISVALLGAPNAGKSSLLNCLVGREAAIVSAEAGTTRDIVDVNINLDGWLVKLGDMAGVRGASVKENNAFEVNTRSQSSDRALTIGVVEQEGIRRARERALQSDVVIAVMALRVKADSSTELELTPEVVDAIKACHTAGKEILFLINKSDLLTSTKDHDGIKDVAVQHMREIFPATLVIEVFFVSCKEAVSAAQDILNHTGAPHPSLDPGGLQVFLKALTSRFTTMTSAATNVSPTQPSATETRAYWNVSLSVTHRQREHLHQCLKHLEGFLEQNKLPGVEWNRWPHTPAQRIGLSHHVDGHDDLVGEVERVIDSHQTTTEGILGSTHDRGAMSLSLAQAADHPPTSADTLPAIRMRSLDEAETDLDIVTAAEHLRNAADDLAKITGRGIGGDVDDVLGVVFER